MQYLSTTMERNSNTKGIRRQQVGFTICTSNILLSFEYLYYVKLLLSSPNNVTIRTVSNKMFWDDEDGF